MTGETKTDRNKDGTYGCLICVGCAILFIVAIGLVGSHMPPPHQGASDSAPPPYRNPIGDGMISDRAIEGCRSRLQLANVPVTDQALKGIAATAIAYGRAYDQNYSDAMLDLCTAVAEGDAVKLRRYGLDL